MAADPSAAIPFLTGMTTALPQNANPSADLAETPQPAADDGLTIGSIALIAFLVADTLQQGLGHALPALLTISPFGMLTAAGWSSAYDNSFIDAGGAAVNFAVALLAGLALLVWKRSSPHPRLLLLLICAFSLFAGSGYLVFAGVTGFGDWYSLLQGQASWTTLRSLLLAAGALLWIASLFIVGSLLARRLGALRSDRRRLFRLAFLSWLSAVVLACVSAAVNRIGIKFVLLSDFPATVCAQIGLLFVPFCIPRRQPANPQPVTRSWSWIAVSAILTLAFVVLLGRGIALHGKLQ